MRPIPHSLLLLGLSSLASAVYQDEVDDVDFHHALFGVPQIETTFFHRPRKDDKASLLYTLGDVGVFGAVNPATGSVVWRHQIFENITNGGGHLRAPEGEDWVAAAYGNSVQTWNALTGRNVWHTELEGEVVDLEIMELTETGLRKDVLVLSKEEDGTATVLRRLHGATGAVVWEFKEHNKDLALQVSTDIAHIYVISLHGAWSSYSLKVTSLDTATGTRVNDWTVGTKGEVHAPEDVMFVGANSAAPMLAWTDQSLSKLSIHVLGNKGKQEIALAPDTTSVSIHAPHHIQSQPHFLVHMRAPGGNRAEVYHTNLKNGQITKDYELPYLKAQSAFSTSSEGANVYFTRITEDEVYVTSSESPAILQRWLLPQGKGVKPVHAVSELVKKPGGTEFAIRSAVATSSDDWAMIRNGELDWSRPEGLSAAVAAVIAEIPESEDLAKVLEQEAETNPLSAYVHRVHRHISDLQYLPAWLQSLPQRVIDSILGGGVIQKEAALRRDMFGFNKIVVVATRRGRFYGLNTGNNGAVVWSTQVFPHDKAYNLDIKGLISRDGLGLVTARGSYGEYADINVSTGEVIMVVGPGPEPIVGSTTAVNGPGGTWLLTLSPSGKPLEMFSAEAAPKGTVVIRGEGQSLRGLTFEVDGIKVTEHKVWKVQLRPGQRIVDVAVRPQHDPVASIGRVLGDRQVNYKYLNLNTLLLAVFADATSTLSLQLVDTASGQILTSQSYKGVDAEKGVSCAISENWYSCSFFGEFTLNDGTTRAIKGYQLITTDLYESPSSNDRGPLGDAANFSSLNPVDTPTGPPLPWIVSQGFVTNQPLTSLAVSQTLQGISNRLVLAYLPEAHGVVGIPRMMVDPRRPVGRDPTAAEVEAEGLMKYFPGMEIDPRTIVSHQRDVLGIKGIVAAPATVESTSLIIAYGVDIFGSRVAPSGVFDILGQGFNKATLILTVVALFGGVVSLAPMVSCLSS
jgi:ER membrane protein complex subunit 1